MTEPHPELTMLDWLTAVQRHRTNAREVLLARGVNWRVIYRKAELSARKGLTEYGVVADRPWLTPEGQAWLDAHSSKEIR